MQGQVLRVLDYSRNSRHLLVTAGDDGSVHLWDATAKAPKVHQNSYGANCAVLILHLFSVTHSLAYCTYDNKVIYNIS